MPESEEDSATYGAMLTTYLTEQKDWITSADLPLVFHLKKLCKQLDADGLDKAALASAYLQAFSRLDRRRPGAPPPVPGAHPDQKTIFDAFGEME